jgi:hypothetical protein
MAKKEKDHYKRIKEMLISNDIDGGMEVKLVRGDIYRPSIVEKSQAFIMMSRGLAAHKISDQGVGSKFLDIVICRKKYLVLIWEDYDNIVMLIDPAMSKGDIFKQSFRFSELWELPYVRLIN